MSVSVCVAKKPQDVCAWVFTCACGEFRSPEFAVHADAYNAFVAHHNSKDIPAHPNNYCFGVNGGGVEPAHIEPWEYWER